MAASPLRFHLLANACDDRAISACQPSCFLRVTAFLHKEEFVIRHFSGLQIIRSAQPRIPAALQAVQDLPDILTVQFDSVFAEVRQACGSLPRVLQLFIDRFGEPTFNAARQRRKEDLLVFIAAAQLRRKIPFNQLSLRLQRDLRSFFGSYANAEEKAREIMFAAGDEDELELATAQLDFGHLDPIEGHFTIHRSLLDELPVILRVYVECAARLYGNPLEADLIKIHLHSRKLTFHYYQDFEKCPLPELLMHGARDLPNRLTEDPEG